MVAKTKVNAYSRILCKLLPAVNFGSCLRQRDYLSACSFLWFATFFGWTVFASAAQSPVEAQRKVQRDVLEEVVVTARRRDEALQDTPIAITAISAADLRDRGITDIREIAKSVPSLQMTDGQIYLRGIGERTSFVRVDPTVGVYLDDLFIPRSDEQQLDAFDIESIQVLRGPQGTLFGKNNTGGAIILTLAKPHNEFEGFVEAGIANFNRLTGKLSVNVPITDRFFTRVSVNAIRDDGFMKDPGFGDRSGGNNRQALVLQSRWEPNDSLTLDTLAYYGRKRDDWTVTNCSVANEDALFIRGLWVQWPGDTDPSNPTAYRENCEANSRSRTGDLRYNWGSSNQLADFKLDTLLLGATLDWQLNDTHSAKAVVGLRDATRGPLITSNNDGGPATFSASYADESDRQSYSLELQLNGSVLNHRLGYTTGLFAMRERNSEPFMLLTSIVGLDATTLLALALGERPGQPSPGGTVPLVGVLNGPLLFSDFDLTNTTLAGYLQGSVDVTERLQFTLGLRYTAERRSTRLVNVGSDLNAIGNRISAHPLFGPAVEGFHPFLGPWAADPVSIAANLFRDETGNGIVDYPLDFNNPQQDRRKETFAEFTPMASASYHVPESWLDSSGVDSAMVYATWSNGFKAGFFEPRGIDGLQRIAPETVENREIGFKLEALQRSLRFNVAAYSMIFDNMQLINVKTDAEGNLAVIFDNAGESRIEGVEVELFWLPLPGLIASLSFSQNRYRFVRFEDLDLAAVAIEGREVAVDRSDEAFPVSPERTAAFGLQYVWSTAVGKFIPRVDVSYKSEIYLGLDRGSWEAYQRDKSLAGQSAYTLVDLRFGWQNLAENLRLTAFVKNLMDKRYLNGTASVGDSIATFNQSYGEPRFYGLEVRRDF